MAKITHKQRQMIHCYHIYDLYHRQKTNLLNIARAIRYQEKHQNGKTRKRHDRKNGQKFIDIL